MRMARTIARTYGVKPTRKNTSMDEFELDLSMGFVKGLEDESENDSGLEGDPDLEGGSDLEEGFERIEDESEEENLSSPYTKEGALDHNKVLAPELSAIQKFKGKPAVLQAWLEAEDLAYKLYADRALYGDSWEEQSPICIRTFRENGIEFDDIHYKVKRVDTPEGLNAFILMPIDVPAGVTPEVKVIFTGTADEAGVARDLEEKAAGHESFKKHKHKLMSELNAAIEQIKGGDVKISVIGHSLGGADAQRMALKITQAVALPAQPEDAVQRMLSDASKQKPERYYPALKKKNITLHLATNSAPKVTEDQCDKFAKNLKMATENKNNDYAPLKFVATVFCMNKDIVPRCGGRHLLATKASKSGEYPSVLSMIDATVVYIKSTLFGHALNFYHNPDHPELRGMNIVHTEKGKVEKSQEEQVRDILDKKSIDASTFAQAIRSVIRTLTVKLGWDQALKEAPTLPAEGAKFPAASCA